MMHVRCSLRTVVSRRVCLDRVCLERASYLLCSHTVSRKSNSWLRKRNQLCALSAPQASCDDEPTRAHVWLMVQ